MMSMGEVSDDMDGVGGDVRWMTYAELGRVRGISTASATRLAFRRKWQRQAGNDGTARVAVPANEARRQIERTHDDMDDNKDDGRGDITRLVSALEAAIAASGERAAADAATIAALREQLAVAEHRLAAERERADRAENSAAHEREDMLDAENRARRAETGREAERSRADALRDRLNGLQAQLAAFERVSDDLQAARTRAEERAGRAENDVFELERAASGSPDQCGTGGP
jgi:chromosome segregation ATPase